MLFEEALRTFLLASPAVQARVQSRIYPEQAAPEEGRPRIVYALQGATPGRTLQGDTNQPVERWELACYGQGDTGYEDARKLAAAVEHADGGADGGLLLNSYRGWLPAGATAANGVWIQSVRVE